ncbi:MAG: M23 family metallopeptidase [Bacilli bacterium]|nr:M23 family metallopeptidase [Bacilli bacterium]
MKFNKNLFSKEKLKKELKKKLRNKILMAISSYLVGLILIVFGLFAIYYINIKLSPNLDVTSYFDTYKEKLSVFLEKGLNFLKFAKFSTDKEVFVNNTMNLYEEYEERGIYIDVPLVLSTLFYPYVDLSDYEVDGELIDKEDVKKISEDTVAKLMRNMVIIKESTYECIKHAEEDEEGNEVISWEEKLVSSEEYLELELPSNHGSCSSTSSEVVKYSYKLDYNHYKDYLRDDYIINNEEFKVPKEYADERLEVHLDNLIREINELSKYFHTEYLGEEYITKYYGTLLQKGILKYMVLPVHERYRITSPFGLRYHPIHNEWRLHNGMDIAAADDNSIMAVADGKIDSIVTGIGNLYNDDTGVCSSGDARGNHVIIKHRFTDYEGSAGYGLGKVLVEFETRYLHLKSINVKVGDVVKPGDVIGVQGTTGCSTGAHLHFAVFMDEEYVNPGDLFNK